MSTASSPGIQQSGSSASHTTGRTRTPLSELPVANFVPRPPSPSKSHTSPTKANKLLPSPSTLHVDSRPSSPGHSRVARSPIADPNTLSRAGPSGRVAIDRGEIAALFPSSDVKSTRLAELPLEQSPEIDRKERAKLSSRPRQRAPSPSKHAAPLTASLDREQGRAGASLPRWQPEELVTPPLGQQSKPFDQGDATVEAATTVLHSLPRKKERVRPTEVAHLLLDQDEDLDLRTGSPSPAKAHRAQRSGDTLLLAERSPGKAALGKRANGQKDNAVGLGITHSSILSVPMHWSVLADADDGAPQPMSRGKGSSEQFAVPLSTDLGAGPEAGAGAVNDMREEDKENAKPDPIVLRGRRKGTGGRLSLVASGGQADETIAATSETNDGGQ